MVVRRLAFLPIVTGLLLTSCGGDPEPTGTALLVPPDGIELAQVKHALVATEKCLRGGPYGGHPGIQITLRKDGAVLANGESVCWEMLERRFLHARVQYGNCLRIMLWCDAGMGIGDVRPALDVLLRAGLYKVSLGVKTQQGRRTVPGYFVFNVASRAGEPGPLKLEDYAEPPSVIFLNVRSWKENDLQFNGDDITIAGLPQRLDQWLTEHGDDPVEEHGRDPRDTAIIVCCEGNVGHLAQVLDACHEARMTSISLIDWVWGEEENADEEAPPAADDEPPNQGDTNPWL